MELKDWQREIIDCIAQGGWQSCPQEVRGMFDEVSLAHMDEYAQERCEEVCWAITKIVVNARRMTLVFHSLDEVLELPLPELRRQMRRSGNISHLLVIGYNGDKLFANLVLSTDVVRIPKDWECTEEVNGIYICSVEKDFNYLDADVEEVVVTETAQQHIPLRVQGDLMVEYVAPIRNWSDLYILQTEAAISAALHDLVELAFVRAGIAFERDNEGRYIVRVRNANPLGTVAIVHALYPTISEHVPHAKIDGNTIQFGFGALWVAFDNNDNNHNRYICRIDFDANISRLNGIFKQFADAYETVFRDLRRTNVQMRVGNHLVEIRNTFPQSLLIPATLEIGGVKRSYLLAARMAEDHFYADDQTEVVIRHPEHGETHIRFTVPGVYRFSHVPHRRDDALSNTIIIRRFMKSVTDPDILLTVVNEWHNLVEAVYVLGKIEAPIKIKAIGSAEDTLIDWIRKKYKRKRISFGKDHVIVSDGQNAVLIRYEVRGDKVVIKSFERP